MRDKQMGMVVFSIKFDKLSLKIPAILGKYFFRPPRIAGVKTPYRYFVITIK